MAYMSQETKAKLAPAIKAVLAKYGVKGSISVDNHSTLVVTIKSGKIDFAESVNRIGMSRPDRHLFTPVPKDKVHIQVNPYWYQEHYDGDAREFIGELDKAMKGDIWYDKSDIMTDYFCTAYYISINIGKWNKPYILETK